MSDTQVTKDELVDQLRVIFQHKVASPLAFDLIADAADEISRLREDAARFENGRIVLGLELTNLRERLARAEEERDQYKLAAEMNAETIKQMQAPLLPDFGPIFGEKRS